MFCDNDAQHCSAPDASQAAHRWLLARLSLAMPPIPGRAWMFKPIFLSSGMDDRCNTEEANLLASRLALR